MLLSYRRVERPQGPNFPEFDVYALTLTTRGAGLLLVAALRQENKVAEEKRMGGVERFVLHNMPELPSDTPSDEPVTLRGTDLYWREVGVMLKGSGAFMSKRIEPEQSLDPGEEQYEVVATASDLADALEVERLLHGPTAQIDS